jgi:hypothetical protein
MTDAISRQQQRQLQRLLHCTGRVRRAERCLGCAASTDSPALVDKPIIDGLCAPCFAQLLVAPNPMCLFLLVLGRFEGMFLESDSSLFASEMSMYRDAGGHAAMHVVDVAVFRL